MILFLLGFILGAITGPILQDAWKWAAWKRRHRK